MGTMRFNHMELTFAPGTLTTAFRQEVDAFYVDVLGWHALDTEVVGQLCHLVETRSEVDSLLEECRRFREKDDRLAIREYEDLVSPRLTVHAFYVRYLLPIWFDVQSMEWAPGQGPERRWDYVRPLPD
jgi:hypothetical protein